MLMKSWICGTLLFLKPITGFAGILMQAETIGKVHCRITIHMEKYFFRTDSNCGKRLYSEILNEEKGLRYDINHKNKTFSVMTKDQFKQSYGQKKDFKKPFSAAHTGPLELRPTNVISQVGPFTCDLFETRANGQKTGDVCVAKWSKLKQFDHKSYEQLEQARKKIHLAWGQSSVMADNALDSIDGLLVRARFYVNGRLEVEWTLKSIVKKKLTGEFSQPPTSYKETKVVSK
jgi:hypothetical protein